MTDIHLVGRLEGSIVGGVKAEVLRGKLLSFKGWIAGLAGLTFTGGARFGGIVTAPVVSAKTLAIAFDLGYRLRLKGTLAKVLTFLDYTREGLLLGPFPLATL